ncbi:MAG TPA: sulfide dehydrogenase [Candidatus Angelobacter sp.]|nr:sulfide dehydrogenase [Candidatus Angelobacter sp.]
MQNQRMNTGLLSAALILIAMGGAVSAQVKSGAYSSGKADTLRQAALRDLAPDAAYGVSPFASLPADLAEGEGLAETQSFCAMCHSTRYITMQPPLPAAVWETEVTKMIKAYGAPIPEASAKKITSYLQTHYTPENRKL